VTRHAAAAPVKALVLAAGAGTRLGPLTAKRPKPMLPVAGRPVLAHTVEALVRHGIADIAINLHHHAPAIVEHFGDGAGCGARIVYSHEPRMLGTAGAAGPLRRFLDTTFVVVFGDVLTDLDFGRLVAFHRARGAVLTMALYRVDNPTEVGLAAIDAAGRVTRFAEKPAAAEVFGDLAHAGVLVCEPRALEFIPSGEPFDFGHDLIPALLRAGEPVYGMACPPGTYLVDIGSPQRYRQAGLDWPARRAPEAIEAYLDALARTVTELRRREIGDAAELLLGAWRERRRIFVLGNGGSAATAAHTVNDLGKATLTPGWPRLKALSLCDNVPLLTAWGNDTEYARVFREPLDGLLEPGDVVLAISTSGNSPNVIEAAALARERGARTIGWTGREGGRLAALADVLVRVPSDHIGRQEDVHQMLDHVLAGALRAAAASPGATPERPAADERRAIERTIEDYLARVERTVRELPRAPVARVVGLLLDAWRHRRRVLLLGNGGSAATAAHLTNDLCKLTLTPGWPRLRALALTDNVPLLSAWANDAGFERAFVEPLLTWVEPDDVVVGISTSGNSPNVVEALAAARACGAVTVGFTGRGGGRVATLADVCLCVPSDHIGRQEDLHLVLGHVVADTLRRLAGAEGTPGRVAAAALVLQEAGACSS